MREECPYRYMEKCTPVAKLEAALAERDAEVQRMRKALQNIRNNAIMINATCCDLGANNEARILIIIKESEVKG